MPVQTQMQVRRGTASSWTSTNPTLAAGELGFETDTGKFKIGNGSSTWTSLLYAGGGQNTLTTYQYTATAGQTTFSGADINSNTLSYTAGAVQVYLNGALLQNTVDYAASTGTSVVLTAGAGLGDSLTILSLGSFTVSTDIPKSTLTAKGSIVAASGAATPANLSVGANDTVLTADSSTATGLKWATPAAGGMTLISTTTLTGASVTLSSIPQTYKNLFVVIRNYVPVVDFNDINFRFNADSTANRHRRLPNSAGDQGVDRAFDATFISMPAFNDNSVGRGLTTITIPDYANTTTWKKATYEAFTTEPDTTTNFQHSIGYGFYNQLSAITSLQFLTSGGNFSSGTILLYGVS